MFKIIVIFLIVLVVVQGERNREAELRLGIANARLMGEFLYLKGDTSVVIKDLITDEMKEDVNGLNFLSTYTITLAYDPKFKFTYRTFIKFTSGKKVSKVSGISGRGIVKYADIATLNIKTIEMVAEDGLYSFLMIIPKDPNGLMELLKELQNPFMFQDIIKQGKEVCATVTMPNGDFINKIDLGDAVRESRFASDVFNVEGLNLRGATKYLDTYYISSIKHAVHLKAGRIYSNNTYDSRCTKYDINVEVNSPHLLYVTHVENVLPIITPVLGLVFV